MASRELKVHPTGSAVGVREERREWYVCVKVCVCVCGCVCVCVVCVWGVGRGERREGGRREGNVTVIGTLTVLCTGKLSFTFTFNHTFTFTFTFTITFTFQIYVNISFHFFVF